MISSSFIHRLAWGLALAMSVAMLAWAVTAQAETIGAGDATYRGKEISPSSAAAKNLTCIQEEDGDLTCFDSEKEALKSDLAEDEAIASGASAKAAAAQLRTATSKKAHAAGFGGASETYMHIGEDVEWRPSGWTILGYARQNWYNMTGDYANAATSASSGNHTGYLADGYSGAGTRLHFYIGDAYPCMCNGTGAVFNDRAQSRYRN